MSIDEMRERLHRYDMACGIKTTLECGIASLETDALNGMGVKNVTALGNFNDGYPHTLVDRAGLLTIGEIATALLPILRAKLAVAEKTVAELQ